MGNLKTAFLKQWKLHYNKISQPQKITTLKRFICWEVDLRTESLKSQSGDHRRYYYVTYLLFILPYQYDDLSYGMGWQGISVFELVISLQMHMVWCFMVSYLGPVYWRLSSKYMYRDVQADKHVCQICFSLYILISSTSFRFVMVDRKENVYF